MTLRNRSNTRRVAACLALAALSSAIVSSARAQVSQWTPDQLDQLLGPVALYPDPLLAMILPASTEPGDIQLAAQYLEAGGDPSLTAGQSWDDSVKALAHYPVVVEWMDQNIAWTTQLGEAYLNQPDDVADSIQRLRARAQAAGTLIDTPQQEVVVVNGLIEIEPTSLDFIYVPYYNPLVVFGAPPYGFNGPFITFGVGFATGPWMTYNWDWRRRSVWVGDWSAAAKNLGHPPSGHRWQPSATRPHSMPAASKAPSSATGAKLPDAASGPRPGAAPSYRMPALPPAPRLPNRPVGTAPGYARSGPGGNARPAPSAPPAARQAPPPRSESTNTDDTRPRQN